MLVPDYVAVAQPVSHNTGGEEINRGLGGAVSLGGLEYQVPRVVRCL